ncbi:hypothetical protein BU15DRAFT_66473 [Melanogaster broomeanus]|nr:hypothetical protein BU15DRAFT_66473 [Melanogaster broomeanus]
MYWTAQCNTAEWNVFMKELVRGVTRLPGSCSRLLLPFSPALSAQHRLLRLLRPLHRYLQQPHEILNLNGTAPLNVTSCINSCAWTTAVGADRGSFMCCNELHPSEQSDRIVAREITAVMKGEQSMTTVGVDALVSHIFRWKCGWRELHNRDLPALASSWTIQKMSYGGSTTSHITGTRVTRSLSYCTNLWCRKTWLGVVIFLLSTDILTLALEGFMDAPTIRASVHPTGVRAFSLGILSSRYDLPQFLHALRGYNLIFDTIQH